MICLVSKPKRAAIVIGCIWITAGMFALPALWLSSSSPLDAPEFDCKADDIVFDLSGCVPIWEVDTDFIINLFKVRVVFDKFVVGTHSVSLFRSDLHQT